MAARAIGVLTCGLLLAWMTFQALMSREVDRLVTAHASEKAGHLVEHFQSNPENEGVFKPTDSKPVSFTEFAHLAAVMQVISISFHDANGRVIGGLNMSERSTGDHATQSRGTYALNDIDLREMPDGTGEPLIEFHIPSPKNLAELRHAHVVFPVIREDGHHAGFMGFSLNVTEIHAAHAKTVRRFGLLFMILGIVLCSVPVSAYLLHKRRDGRRPREAGHQPHRDCLTGLLNRDVFGTEAQRWLDQNELGFAVAINVDRFKSINDTHGHGIGDAFLKHVAQNLKTAFGPNCLIARLGADAFTLALPNMTKAEVQQSLDAFAQSVRAEVELDGITVSTSISMGIAQPSGHDNLDGLSQRADTALYYAKSQGRNRTAFFTPSMGAAARRRRCLEGRLREACENGDFQIYFQPWVDAASTETLGFEALLRLNDTDGTPIPPDEFVPIAEDTGLIEEIGTWVLFKATEEIAFLDDHSSVSINLSAEQFRSGRLLELVTDALGQSGLPPHRLELEITESTLFDTTTRAQYQIDALQEIGISVALDDFGTGLSSLSTLWKFSLDRIKIDASFVQALETEPETSAQMIATLVQIGAHMDMNITAEGVETDMQRDMLAGMGCNVLQGYLFGRPSPMSHHQKTANLTQTPLASSIG